ncbi:MAG TPA: HAMP domain-containing sensor histidine kinase [Pirellulales bacterium]|jgi:signal transduction histidine kinase|nr:HAMP domain-containing sensor histidine kinase [Pirellulales bacterium]
MRFEHIKTLLRSLRFRLSAWNTAAVLLTVGVTLVGVREALRYTLIVENDHLLLDDTDEVILAIGEFYPDLGQIYSEMERKERGHVDRDLFVQLLDTHGQVMRTSGSPPDLKGLPRPTINQPSLLSVGGYRVAQRLLAKVGLPAYTVRVGASLATVDNDVATLTRLMVAAGTVILFVAPVSGYWLAGRATRPLARIITTAARLRPSHMEERLPIRGTGDELDQLSLTINRFLDLLGDYLERNREFVANAAHELRSPLAAVQSSVEVTLNTDRTIEEYQDLLCEIADQCGQLRVLVNQLLLLAETDAVRFPVEKRPVRFDQLLEKSIDMFRGAAEERGINLISDVRDQIVVEGDGDRLRQVVNNLIDNSLKFTLRGGQVLISLRYESAHRQLVLQVADTGPGISPLDLPHVFERFYRGDKSRQRENLTHGNGLGLSICQSIITAHGGTIRADSAPGHGATFTVLLPAAAGEGVARPDAPRVSYSS